MADKPKTEIAYFTFDRQGRRSASKRKVVLTSRLTKELTKMDEKGYEVYGTRDAE